MKHSNGDDAQLSPFWVVAFTGHRDLKNPVAVGRVIREELEVLRREVPGEIVGYARPRSEPTLFLPKLASR